MANSLKKNRILRKSFSLIKQIPRTRRRISAKAEHYRLTPPVIANSFPKSGTHLLLQILEALPCVTNYGTFITTMPALRYRELSQERLKRSITNIVPSEIIPAHLFYAPVYDDELVKRNCVHFFIYRDLRDVVISEAYYLTYQYRIHRMHSYYAKSLANMEDRILTAILGVTEPGFPYDYPNIAKRFARYQGWLKSSHVFPVKFEDLVSGQLNATLCCIVKFFAEHCAAEFDIDEVSERLASNINPANSPTFREGKVGGWKNMFTEKHKEHMKSIAGELLIQLDYEKDMNW